jgi:hypothetical protein
MSKRAGRKTARGVKKTKIAMKTSGRRSPKRPVKRPKVKRPIRKASAARVAAPKARAKRAKPSSVRARANRPVTRSKKQPPAAAKTARVRRATPARLDRARRTLEETVQTPPSSLDLNRRGSAVRTGRAEMEESRQDHATLTPSITGGDIDTSVEDAYFNGDEAPGGDNPTPDQDIVDDIGKALGVEYQDNEELRASDKVIERDKHRWELDPASAEDYKDRK